jgi:hypothetical protein
MLKRLDLDVDGFIHLQKTFYHSLNLYNSLKPSHMTLCAALNDCFPAKYPSFRNGPIVFQEAIVRGPTLFARDSIYSNPQIHDG